MSSHELCYSELLRCVTGHRSKFMHGACRYSYRLLYSTATGTQSHVGVRYSNGLRRAHIT